MLTNTQRLTIALALAACLALLGLLIAAWPAVGADPHPMVTPTTYGAPGPNGGAR